MPNPKLWQSLIVGILFYGSITKNVVLGGRKYPHLLQQNIFFFVIMMEFDKKPLPLNCLEQRYGWSLSWSIPTNVILRFKWY